MSSQVNPNSINPSYPTPGVNQSSQGFRSNFLAIQNFAKQYVLEMNDLINKVIVSAPLTYGSQSTINDFGGMLNSNMSSYDSGLKVWNLGAITTSNTVPISFGNGAVQTFSLTGTAGGTQSVNISEFPGLGYSEVILNVTATNPPQFINFGNLVIGGTLSTNGGVNIAGFNASTANFAMTSSSPYSFTLGSLDGINWTLSARGTAIARMTPPSTNLGAIGDTTGMIASDPAGSFIYICIGNYDGVTAIWKRTATSTF